MRGLVSSIKTKTAKPVNCHWICEQAESSSTNQPAQFSAFHQLLLKADLSSLPDLRWLRPKVALSYITTCYCCLCVRQGARIGCAGFHGCPTPGSWHHFSLPSSGKVRNYRPKPKPANFFLSLLTSHATTYFGHLVTKMTVYQKSANFTKWHKTMEISLTCASVRAHQD